MLFRSRAKKLADAVAKYGAIPPSLSNLQSAYQRDGMLLEEKRKELARITGGEDVGQTDTGTDGAGVSVPAQPSDTLAPAPGAGAVDGTGMGAPRQDAGTAVEGKGEKPSAVTEEKLRAMTDEELAEFEEDLDMEILVLGPDEDTERREKLVKAEIERRKNTSKEVPRETPPTPAVQTTTAPEVETSAAPQATEVVTEETPTETARPTPKDIKTGMAFDEATIGNLYNEDRVYGADETNEKGERVPLPEWNKLTRDQKDLYLGYIKNNTGEEHDAARNALIKYRAELREASRVDAQPEIDIINERPREGFASDEEYEAYEKAKKEKLDRVYRKISDIKANPAAAQYIYKIGRAHV